MSFALVRSYFRDRCNAIGLSEHIDAFNNDNIAASVIDNSYHLGAPTISSRQLHQGAHSFDSNMEIGLFFKGYANPSDGLDRAISTTESLVKEIEKPSNKHGTSCINTVVVQSINFEALDATNDNVIRVRLVCNVLSTLGL